MTNLKDDYVLGTHDAELNRLGLQHRVWRSRALEGWRRAGFTVGQTLLDIGCGPGYASLDLAEVVGPNGRVLAFDRSARFLDALQNAAVLRALPNINTRHVDLAEGDLDIHGADGAWVRWVFAFLPNPRELVTRIAAALRPGGTLVIHEYFDYRAWSFMQRSPLFDEFVAAVIRSWRVTGGEPDVARTLPSWLEDEGFRITSLRPYVDVVTPADYLWEWPKAFVESATERLVPLGELTEGQAAAIRANFDALERAPRTRMITPAVLEIVAVRSSPS